MLLITAWLVSSVGHGNIAGAENSGPPTSQSASVKRFAWKVKSSSAEVTMLGSIHAGKPEMYPMPKEIESAFAAAYTLVVEVDIRNQNQASIINLIKEKGMYSDDDNLFKHIKPETQEAVASFCTTYRLPVEAAQKMRPWMFVLTATTLPLMKSGYKPELGVDYYFLNKVKSPMKVKQLESADFQIKLLSSIPENQADLFISETVKEVKDSEKNSLALQQVWLSGDESKLLGFIKEHDDFPGDFGKKIFDDRNKTMTDSIAKILKGTGKSFVVIGAGHFVGENGILNLLKLKGYHVEKLALSAPR